MKITLHYTRKKKRKKKHGFLKRSKNKTSRWVILRRIRKGRHQLTV